MDYTLTIKVRAPDGTNPEPQRSLAEHLLNDQLDGKVVSCVCDTVVMPFRLVGTLSGVANDSADKRFDIVIPRAKDEDDAIAQAQKEDDRRVVALAEQLPQSAVQLPGELPPADQSPAPAAS